VEEAVVVDQVAVEWLNVQFVVEVIVVLHLFQN
jgi:hypothetical protein